MLKVIWTAVFLLAIFPEPSFAFGGRARRAAARVEKSYTPTYYYAPSYGRRIDTDESDYRFPYSHGQRMSDSDGEWKWDADSQVWRGPVSVYSSRNGGPWTLERQYWRK